ncbi:MAG: ABC transporter permease [Treponema sp.]|jgi:simple sugar transport system permease protein|nr:ABC transporter permease [Treponema sp.]
MKHFELKRQRISSQLVMPFMILFLLVIVNLIVDSIIMKNNPAASSFFSIKIIKDTFGNDVLSGSIVNLLNNASELVILAIGMTLVTAASGGQDISVGAVAAVAGSIFLKLVRLNEIAANESVTWIPLIFAFLTCCAVSMMFGAFNGSLVGIFKIQPMIATLILFTAGRSIAYGINGGASPKLFDDITRQIGTFFSGNPIPSPIFIVLIYVIGFYLLLRFTNLRLYVESVGINQKASRLNGLNPVVIKIMVYAVLGLCVAGAGVINTCRMQRLDHLAILSGIEMDAILAVAIGGNALSGGKFSIVGSIIGAYTIEILNMTLLRLRVDPEPIKAYKAVFIVLLMLFSSTVVKEYAGILWKNIKMRILNVSKGEA